MVESKVPQLNFILLLEFRLWEQENLPLVIEAFSPKIKITLCIFGNLELKMSFQQTENVS